MTQCSLLLLKEAVLWLWSRSFMTSVKRQRSQQSFEKSHGIKDTKTLRLPMYLGVKDPRSWRERRSRKLSRMLRVSLRCAWWSNMTPEMKLDAKQMKCRIHFPVIFHCYRNRNCCQNHPKNKRPRKFPGSHWNFWRAAYKIKREPESTEFQPFLSLLSPFRRQFFMVFLYSFISAKQRNPLSVSYYLSRTFL